MTDRRRRRQVVGVTAAVAAGLLGVSLSTKPGSRRFYGLTMGVAGVLAGGAVASGPLTRGWRTEPPHRPVVEPVAIGATAFAAFYGAARTARRIPPLRRALTSVLQYAHEGSDGLVLLTALSNGAAEELFFRGALYDAAGEHPIAKSTAAYVVATTATRNPALVMASAVMGTLFATQRKQTGGIQASTLTHLTWSALMLRYLPPLFAPPKADTSTEAEASRG